MSSVLAETAYGSHFPRSPLFFPAMCPLELSLHFELGR